MANFLAPASIDGRAYLALATAPDAVAIVPVRFDFPASYEILAAVFVPPSDIVSVTVTPSTLTMLGGAGQQFTATVEGTNNPNLSVIWTASAGTISQGGAFNTPPAISSDQTILVRATSVQDSSKWGESVVRVAALPTVDTVVVTPQGVALSSGASYQFSAVVSGANGPSQAVTWATTAGSVSAGGVVTSPDITGENLSATVTATSVLDPSKSGSVSFTVLAANVEPNPIDDSESPVIPGTLTISEVTSAGFKVTWSSASDNIGVVGYEVSVTQGTESYTNFGNTLTATISGLSGATAYNVRVRAYDKAGNRSTALTTTATTAVTVDTASPIFSGSIVVSSVTATGFTTTWPSASDNVGVVSYEVSIDTGTPNYLNVGTLRTKVAIDLVSGTLYNIRVRAVDAAGNKSAVLLSTASTSGLAPLGPEGAIVLKQAEGPLVYQLSTLLTTPTEITYKVNTGQEIVLFNNGTASAVVTLKGSTAGAVTTKGLAGVTVDLSGGLLISVPAKEFVTLKLDNAVLYLKGVITLTTGGTSVFAGVLQ